MKKSFLIFAALLVCLSFTVSALAQKGKPAPGCGSDFAASLFVNGGTGIKILPDGQGSLYVNSGKGKNQVSIGFQVGNCSYDLIVHLGGRFWVTNINGTIFNAKSANFDRIASVPITTDLVAMNNFCNTFPPANDNYAGCGTDSLGRRYVRRNVGMDLGNGVNNLRFQESPLESPTPPVAGTAYIKVYHPNVGTWELVPENAGENNGLGEVGAFLTNGVRTGSPVVPFWFTVTRL